LFWRIYPLGKPLSNSWYSGNLTVAQSQLCFHLKPWRNEHSHAASVTLTDEAGRSLACYIERSLFVEDQEYVYSFPLTLRLKFSLGSLMEEEEAIPVEDERPLTKFCDRSCPR